MKKKNLMLAVAVVALTLGAGMAHAMNPMTDGTEMKEKASMMMHKKDMGMMKGKHGMMNVPGLSEEGKKVLQETKKKNCEDRSAHRSEMKKKNEELNAILKAEKFDKKAFLAKKAEISNHKMKMKEKHTNAMAGALEKLSAKDRAAMAEHHSKRMGKRGKGMMGGDCPMMSGHGMKK